MKARKVYISCFLHHDATPSIPMAVFSNKKAAKEFIEEQNNNLEFKWYYYAMDAETAYWWSTKKEGGK